MGIKCGDAAVVVGELGKKLTPLTRRGWDFGDEGHSHLISAENGKAIWGTSATRPPPPSISSCGTEHPLPSPPSSHSRSYWHFSARLLDTVVLDLTPASRLSGSIFQHRETYVGTVFGEFDGRRQKQCGIASLLTACGV